MKKIVFTILVIFTSVQMMAQKPQRIAYIDMVYILNQVQDYQQATSALDMKVKQWQTDLESKKKEVETMEASLNAERALLTHDLIADREEDINIKRQEYQELQNKYFGMDGDLFRLRQQLVKPVQDKVFNAVQEIASKRKYDFVLDKSSDLIMLYSNNKYDISDQVVNAITRGEKIKSREEKRKAVFNKRNKKKPTAAKNGKEIAEEKAEAIEQRAQEQAEAMEEREKEMEERMEEVEAKKAENEEKRQEMLDKVEEKKAEREKKMEERRKKIEEKRKERLAKREEAKRKMLARRDSILKAREEKKKEQENNN
ncbi:MAG: hypothetical protein CR968_02130 [Flavobacteriia bacterium]|nr:MAG: hypothetical protein CR968_02130 [Flavobacteriia bacterium]